MNFTENLERGLTHLHKQGAFLTVKDGTNVNTMTISWGSIGFMWNKPIFTVMVRKSRHTHPMIENSKEFTVSVPLNNDLKKELAYCGTKSGRDVDKFKECNLLLENAKSISAPIIGNCELHYECRVVYKQDMIPEFLKEDIDKACYSDKDYHTLYYGEIVSCYIK